MLHIKPQNTPPQTQRRTAFATPRWHSICTAAIAIAIMLSFTHQSAAQQAQWTLRSYATVGHNYTNAAYASVAALADARLANNLHANAGLRAGLGQPLSATLGWHATIGLPVGTLALQVQWLCNNHIAYDVAELSSRATVGYSVGGFRAALGLADRIIAPSRIVDLGASADYVLEPWNLCYEVQYSHTFGKYTVGARIADFDDFVCDRGYQPLFAVEASRQLGNTLQLWGKVLCHPTGMFSLNANYYEVQLCMGIIKQW